MKLLLINPKYPESFWSFKWAVKEVLPRKRAVNPPLGLATLAALSPTGWDVTIVDENVESILLAPDADLVGVCGMGVQFPRQTELLAFYREAGYPTVAGGSFASLCPERYVPLADSVVAGEAEYIWKRFCADFETGRAQPLYRETGTVSLSDSPVPRFDLLKIGKYTTATLQFSRGCPYMCEFCDIIVMFGRKPRHKSVEQVGRELDALRATGARNAFFVDDNLIGHRAAAKELLRYLAEYQRQHGYPFNFGTEVSLNLAQDKELLELFRAAGFSWVFVGIESSDPEALKQTRKTQNTHEDVLTSVRRIYAHDIDVLGGFIVGFDSDTEATFGHQERFILDSGVQAAMVGLLTALPKTPLYQRLEKEGRLRPDVAGTDNTKPATNVEPKHMSYEAMVAGYETMYRRLTRPAAIAERIRNKLRYMRAPVYQGEYSTVDRIGIIWRLLTKGILPGGLPRIWHFLFSLPLFAPRKLPVAIVDWIAGLSMRDYVQRHFPIAPSDAGRAQQLFEALLQGARRHGAAVRVSLSLRTVAPSVSISLRGGLPGAFFRRAARKLDRLLSRTQASVTLRIDALRESELPHLHRLLERLARHGDRISVIVSKRLRGVVKIDSSVFRLVLARE
ncbi:MAG: radical SAM protein [Burkholderiales bacterium]